MAFDFSRLIEKYSVDSQLIRPSTGGKYVGGNWIPDAAQEPEIITGAIIPMTDRKIYQSGGTYTEKDRELITETEIPLEPAAYIVFQENKYQVESETDYSIYAGFHDYNLKRVGAFDRTESN